MPAPYSGINRSNHNHMDGSRALLTWLFHLHTLSGKKYPFNQWARHHEQIIAWFSDVHRDIVEQFKITTGVMQNHNSIFKSAEEYVVYYGRKGFESLKATIAPQYCVFGDSSTSKKLNEKNVMEIIVSGMIAGQKRIKKEINRDIKVQVLFGIGREVSPEESLRLTQIAASCDRKYVPGITLVCHEPSNPPEKHLSAFQFAKAEEMERRCHVEWVKDRPDKEKNTPEKILRNYQK